MQSDGWVETEKIQAETIIIVPGKNNKILDYCCTGNREKDKYMRNL